MMVKIEEKEYQKSNWSGGTTTQLFIWPPQGDYATRNFQFRLSSATIEEEQSTFTKLPNIYRYLSILEGNLDISITEDRQSRNLFLRPFQLMSFRGDQQVESKGKARDFNLMLQNCKGKLEGAIIDKKEIVEIKSGCIFIYVEKGRVLVQNRDKKEDVEIMMEKESLYEIAQEARSYSITPDSQARLMIAWIEL